MMKMESLKSISVLPDELLLDIYTFLDLPTYWEMRKTSKRFHQLSFSSFYLRRTTYEIEQERDPYFVAVQENDLNYFKWLQSRKYSPSYPAIRRIIAFERKEMLLVCSFYIEDVIHCFDLLVILLDLADLEVVELIVSRLKHVQEIPLISLEDDRNRRLFEEKYKIKMVGDVMYQPQIIYPFLRYQNSIDLGESSVCFPAMFISSIILTQDPFLIKKIYPYFSSRNFLDGLCSLGIIFTKQILNAVSGKFSPIDLDEIAQRQLSMKKFDNLKVMIEWGWKPDDVFIRHLFRIIWEKKDGYKDYIDFMFFCLRYLTEIAYQHPNFDLEQFKIYLLTLKQS